MSRPQRIRVPWRVITSSHYGDPAVSVYVKVAALGDEGGVIGASLLVSDIIEANRAPSA